MASAPTIHRERLDNGLTVLAVPRPGVRVVAADMWVAVGSANEPPAINGVSHFLEHMLFKGTERRSVGEIDRTVEGFGGYLNAATSHDFTHFYITAAAENFPLAADILADVMEHATLDAEELDSERQVILEEYSRKQDSPQGLLWETLYEKAFEQGPYKAPVLGAPESLERIGREEMLDYYRRHYAPENMTLVVVGDLEASEIFSTVRRAFGPFDRPYRPLLDPSAAPTLYAPKLRHAIQKDVNETYGVMAFPAPALGESHPAAYALDVLQFVLGGGNASALHEEIKEKRRLATSISAGYASSRHPDLFYVFYTCDEAKRDELEEAVLEQLERARTTLVAPRDLDRARKLLMNAHAFSLETTNGQSGSIGYYQTVTGETDFEWNYIERIRSITDEEVRRQAERVLTPDRLGTVVVRPKTS